MSEGLDDCTHYEGKDGYAIVDKFQYEAMQKQWESQRQELLDRLMVLELENENLRRQLEREDAQSERLADIILKMKSKVVKQEVLLMKCRDHLRVYESKMAADLIQRIDKQIGQDSED